MEIVRALDRTIHRVILEIGRVMSFVLLLLSVFVFLCFFTRIIGLPVPGLFSISIICFIAFAFLASAYTLGEGRHVTIDVITPRLPENSRISLEILGYFFCLAFAIILGLEGAKWVTREFIGGTLTGGTKLGTIEWPFWPIAFPVPLGSFLLVVQSLRLIVKRMYFFIKKGDLVFKECFSPVALVLALFVLGIVIAIFLNPVGGLFISLVTLFLGGIPVAFAIGVVGIIGLYLFAGGPGGLVQVPITAFSVVESYPLAALPLFVIIGTILGKAGATDNLFSCLELWLGRVRGSLLMVTIATGAVLCAITGSSIAATAILSLICLPALLGRGFDKRLSAGTVAAGSVGSLIPPSVGLIVYGILVEESIGKLFMAALVPSLMTFVLFALFIYLTSIFQKGKFGKLAVTDVTWSQKFSSLKTSSFILFLPFLILGGIYLGFFTATEAAGVAVIYGLLVVLFIMRNLNWKRLNEALLEGSHITSMTLSILIGGILFATLISQLRIGTIVTSFAADIGLSSIVVVIVMFVTIGIMGMFISSVAVKLITIPVFFPLAMSVGIHPLWLGVFYIYCTEIALLTPPVGMNLFVIQGVSKLPFLDVVRGVLPFLGIMTLSVAIIYIFPDLATWLPSTMYR